MSLERITLSPKGDREMRRADNFTVIAGLNAEGQPVGPLADADGRLQVATPSALVDLTLTPDTSIMASGDVIADTQEVAAAVPAAGGAGVLQSLILIDESDQKAALDLLFFSANVSLGTENSGPSVSDGNADSFLGKVAIATADYADLGGVSVVTKTGLGLILRGATDSRSVYVAVLNGSGTPTYAASSLKLRLGVI